VGVQVATIAVHLEVDRIAWADEGEVEGFGEGSVEGFDHAGFGVAHPDQMDLARGDVREGITAGVGSGYDASASGASAAER